MSLQSEIIPYTDGNGLVAPTPVPPGVIRASDNGPMFTSEYSIMLNRQPLSDVPDIIKSFKAINNCVGNDMELHRAPGDVSPDEIDDHLGVLALYVEAQLIPLFKLPIRLWRFPQLVYVYLLAKSYNSILLFPLGLITAIILATSCIGVDKSQADPRRLNWLLWQATKRKSFICNLAGKFWHWRQKKIYGTDQVMRAVASIYYSPGHPFSKYWID